MKQFGLIGRKLSHSFSKTWFSSKFSALGLHNHVYDLFELADISDFPALLQSQPALLGLNVTIPYKSAVLPYLNYISDEASAAGAVNCIAVHRQNEQIQLYGYNTDIYGFKTSLQPLLSPWHQKALLLGTGGASKAVQCALDQLGIGFTTVSRTAGLTYDMLTEEHISSHLLIINTTPLGMYPDTESMPALPYKALTPRHLAYDLVYNPDKTAFMKKAAVYGAKVKNGLEMLHLQAETAWKIFREIPEHQ